jgi:hypothetical protein
MDFYSDQDNQVITVTGQGELHCATLRQGEAAKKAKLAEQPIPPVYVKNVKPASLGGKADMDLFRTGFDSVHEVISTRYDDQETAVERLTFTGCAVQAHLLTRSEKDGKPVVLEKIVLQPSDLMIEDLT